MKKLFTFLVVLMLLPFASAQADGVGDPGVTPDSFLWGLDKALEQLNLLLTFDEGKKAKKGLEIAQERLLEVKSMVDENKLDAAVKAKDEHGKTLMKVKQSIKEIEEDDSTEEIEEVIEIERELEEHDEDVEETFGELKVKIKVEGEITQQQADLIDSILSSLKGQTGEVEIEIKNKKDKTKIKIEQETGKSEEEIEIEIEGIEKEKGIKKQEKAFEAIEETEKEFKEFLEEAEEKGIVVSQDLIDQFNSLLEQAINQFEQDNFVEAKKLAKQAEELLDESEEFQEGEDQEIKVEIEEGKAKVEVELGGAEWEFELDTVDLDAIINEISVRTGLTAEQINAILNVEVEEEEEDEIELEAEAEKGKTKVKIKIGDEKHRFILDTVSEAEVVAEIITRTSLSEDVVKTNLEFEFEDEYEQENDEVEDKEDGEDDKEDEENEDEGGDDDKDNDESEDDDKEEAEDNENDEDKEDE
ncbi:hypothetical protein ISS07_02810 [Candidatus Woesearchaeota archaeon]|nr:hypothetical protein [Candidatus Woesearchaeota archaeon]